MENKILLAKVSTELAQAVERIAQRDARLEADRPNVSSVIRRALVAYVKARESEDPSLGEIGESQ